MTTIYEFLNAWRELIMKVFGEYPPARALITILAVGTFYGLQTEWRRRQMKSNLLLVRVRFCLDALLTSGPRSW